MTAFKKKGDSCGEQVSQDQRPCRHQHKENKVEIFFSDIASKGKMKKKKLSSILGTVENSYCSGRRDLFSFDVFVNSYFKSGN